MKTTEIKISIEQVDAWANDPNGPVALHLKQNLAPVDDSRVIFPPTYADIGYNIDTLSDGTKVATIDSVGSQANRMEPMFKSTGKNAQGEELNPLARLIPQIEIILDVKEKDGEKYEKRQSLLDLAHRSADAVVKATPELRHLIDPAFLELHRHGNAWPLCALAPTSLLFGVWDSRDGTGEKLPRLVRSMIRAWDVEILHSAAQFNSVWKALSEEDQKALEAESKKKGKTKLSVAGLADAPAVFRTEKLDKYVNGAPNPEARVLGGVLAKGRIERTVTINLVALRALKGSNQEETQQLHTYLLTLALLAATTEQELFLREGCLLRYEDEKDTWTQVPRRGEPAPVEMPDQDELLQFAHSAAEPFRVRWPRNETGETELLYKFDLKKAKELLSKKTEDEADAS